MSSVTGPPPRRRPWHAAAWLDHVAIVSYLVDADALDDVLPPGLRAQRVEVGATIAGVVSAVSSVDRRFHFRGVPWITLTGGQIDYRTYVRSCDGAGVWFFAAGLDSPLEVVARRGWSMPWHRARISLTASWQGPDLERMALRADGPGVSAALVLAGASTTDPPSAADEVLGADPHVTDPLHGWYARRSGAVCHYRVWHEPLDLRPARVVEARYDLFVDLGLVGADQAPDSALVQRTVALEVQTPPRRWRQPASVSERDASRNSRWRPR